MSLSNITRVTLGVVGWFDEYRTATPNARTFQLSNFVIDTSSGPLNTPGSYVLRLWAKSTTEPDPQSPVATVTLVVKPNTTPPVVSGLNTNLSVTQGDAVALSGQITSETDLTKVTIGVVGWLDEYQTRWASGRSFSLSTFVIDTSSSWLNNPGTYTINLWATSTGYPNPQSPLAVITLRVNPRTGRPPVVSGLNTNLSVTQGDRVTLNGQVTSDTDLTKVTIGVVGWTDEWQTRWAGGRTFDLSAFEIDASGWLSNPGTYTINLWATSLGYQDPQSPLAVIRLTVKEKPKPAAPKVSGLVSTLQVTQGKSLRLNGMVTAATSLSKVTVGIQNWTDVYQTYEPNSPIFALSQFLITTADGFLSTPGTYTLTIWAATPEFPAPAQPLGTVTLTVTPSNDPPAASGMPATLEVQAGQVVALQGEVQSLTTLTEISLTIDGRANAVVRAPAGRKFNLAEILLDTTALGLDRVGNHSIVVNAKSEGYPFVKTLGQISLQITSSGEPVLSGFPKDSTQTIKVGDRYPFSGHLMAESPITDVTVLVVGENRSVSARPRATQFDLGSLAYDTTVGDFAETGSFRVEVWAKTERAPNPSRPLAAMTLVVQPGDMPDLQDLPVEDTVKQGRPYAIPGRVVSTSKLQKVTAVIVETAPDGASSYRELNAFPTGNTFELKEFQFATSPGATYSIRIWAKSVSAPDPQQALGTMVLRTVKVAPTRVEEFEQWAVVRFGDRYTLKGLVRADRNITRISAVALGSDQIQSAEPNARTFSLDQFHFFFTEPGIHLIQLWVKTTAEPDPTGPVSTIVVDVRRANQLDTPYTYDDGYRIFGLWTNERTTLPGMAFPLQGMLVAEAPLKVVNFLVIKDGLVIDNTTFRRDGRGSKVFDFGQLEFTALKPFDVPGTYTMELWASSEGHEPRALGQFDVTVEPTVLASEAYYVNTQDRVYVSAQVTDKVANQAGQYPIVAANVFDGQSSLGSFRMDRLPSGTFEVYIPAVKLVRGRPLTVNVAVDGYDAWDQADNPNQHGHQEVTVPENKWIIAPGSQRFTMGAGAGGLNVEAQTNQSLPVGHTVELGVFATGAWRYFPLTGKAGTKHTAAFTLAALGLARGSSYRMVLRLNAWGVESDRTGESVVTVPVLQQPTSQPAPAVTSYLDFAKQHKILYNQNYDFVELSEALSDTANFGTASYMLLKNLANEVKSMVFSRSTDFDDASYESEEAYRQAVIEMINVAYSQNWDELASSVFLDHAAEIKEALSTAKAVYKGTVGKVQVSPAMAKLFELETDVVDWNGLGSMKIFDFLQDYNKLVGAKEPFARAGSILRRLDKADTIVDFAGAGVGTALIWFTVRDTNDQIMYAFKEVAEHSDNANFHNAVSRLMGEYESNKAGFFTKIKLEEMAAYVVSFGLDQVFQKAAEKHWAVAVAFGVYKLIQFSGVIQRNDQVFQAITAGFVQNEASKYYRKALEQSSDSGVMSAVLVYLLAGKYASLHFAEFLETYDKTKYAGRITALKTRSTNCANAVWQWTNQKSIPW